MSRRRPFTAHPHVRARGVHGRRSAVHGRRSGVVRGALIATPFAALLWWGLIALARTLP